MSSIRSLLSKFQSSSDERKRGEKITPDILEQLFPIRNLSEEIRQSFASEAHAELLNAGARLFSINTDADSAIYLLKGTVSITDKNGKSYDIDAGSAQSKFPLCSGHTHTTTAIAKTDISILRVSINIMATNNRFEHKALQVPENLRQNRLLALFADHYQNHELDIPTLPQVALKLRQAIQRDVNLNEAAEIIQLDPAISAKLVEVANCPLYLTLVPARNCFDAIKRIGLNATRSLVIALSLKQIFKTKSPLVKSQMETLWRQSLYLSALSHVLASTSQQQNPEDALLAGLISDIGAIPFLSFVANLPVEFINKDEIDQALPVVIGPVGATVLKEWQFTDDFIDVALNSRDWYESSGRAFSLTDVVVLSRLHASIGQKSSRELPAIHSIPAASKLKNMALSPENTLSILHDAKVKIQEALAIFSS